MTCLYVTPGTGTATHKLGRIPAPPCHSSGGWNPFMISTKPSSEMPLRSKGVRLGWGIENCNIPLDFDYTSLKALPTEGKETT